MGTSRAASQGMSGVQDQIGKDQEVIDEAQLDKWFTPHDPSPAQKDAYEEVLKQAKRFAIAVNENMPDGEDKLQVINGLRQSILTVELAIRYRFSSGIVLTKGVQ